jgi:hypothetical protein
MSTEITKLIAANAITEATRIANSLSPDSAFQKEAAQTAKRMITQDPWRTSWRVWGAMFSGVTGLVTGLLLIPEVQIAIQAIIGQTVPAEYIPLTTALLGTLWPIISKIRDKRPIK